MMIICLPPLLKRSGDVASMMSMRASPKPSALLSNSRLRKIAASLPVHFASSINTRVQSAVPVDLPRMWSFPSVMDMPMVLFTTSWHGMRWIV